MKKNISIVISLLIVMFSGFLSAQNKYYKSGDGKILDQGFYDQIRNSRLEKLQANDPNMDIYDELDEVHRTKDSVIYVFKWHYTNDLENTKSKIETKKSFIGKEFPLGEVQTLDGKKITLEDLKGKPTLINFWFTSCAPCIEEMPELNRMKDKYGKKFNFLALTFESKEKVEEFLSSHSYDWMQVADRPDLTTEIGFDSFPTNLFLDKNGVLNYIRGNMKFNFSPEGEILSTDSEEFIILLEGLSK